MTRGNDSIATVPAAARWHSYADIGEAIGDYALLPHEQGDVPRARRSTPTVADDLPLRDVDALRTALVDCDPRILLMVLVHLSRDETLLDLCAPHILPSAKGGNKLPSELAEMLRDRLATLLTQDPRPVEQPMPTRLLQRMMSVCAGEHVGDEFIPLLLEQAGFTGEQATHGAPSVQPPGDFKVIVIGAGMSGLAAGVRLGERGFRYEILERKEDVGGTWLQNIYPGVAVDTPSHFYSFSFEINPDWPRYFSQGGVVEDYLRHCARKYGVDQHVRFGTSVDQCVYDEGRGLWLVHVRDANGQHVIEANAVITATGRLNRPSRPAIPGLDSFAGPTPHTAEWDPSLDLAGKRVGVIGVGASSMQIGPAIVEKVAHLTVFQRTPHWVIPNPSLNAPVPMGVRWTMRHVPYYAQWQRFLSYWTMSDGGYPNVRIDPEWTDQSVSISPQNHARREALLKHIAKELEGRPDLIEKMTPDYPVNGKRIIQDNDWFKMMRRDDVSLETGHIDHVEPNAVVMRSGERIELDVLILATGFQLYPMLHPIRVVGRDGVDLADQWGEEDPRAYLGTVAPNFPNFFVMSGPNAGPNHGAGLNIVAEAQATYIAGCLSLMLSEGADAIEVRENVHDEYNDAIDAEMLHMVWAHPKANSYYLNSKRRVVGPSPWRLVDLWWMMRAPRPDHFVLTSIVLPERNVA